MASVKRMAKAKEETLREQVNEAFEAIETIGSDATAMEQIRRAFEANLQDGTAEELGEGIDPLDCVSHEAGEYEIAYFRRCQKDGFEVIDSYVLASNVLQRLLADHPDSPLASLSSVEAQLITIVLAFKDERFPGDFHGRLADYKLIAGNNSTGFHFVSLAFQREAQPQ